MNFYAIDWLILGIELFCDRVVDGVKVGNYRNSVILLLILL